MKRIWIFILFLIILLPVLMFNYFKVKNTIIRTNEIVSFEAYVVEEISNPNEKLIKKWHRYIYSAPSRLRVEEYVIEHSLRSVEIYDGDKNIYYNNLTGTAYNRKCKAIDGNPIIFISPALSELYYSKEFEFLGYEKKDDRFLKILGIYERIDGKKYYKKIWVESKLGVLLPYMEEFFINDVVVERRIYSFYNVNGGVNEELFQLKSLSPVNIIDFEEKEDVF